MAPLHPSLAPLQSKSPSHAPKAAPAAVPSGTPSNLWDHDPVLAEGIPDYLNRTRPRLGSPAISSGPDDDLGDLQ
jgi:hypothetical protein